MNTSAWIVLLMVAITSFKCLTLASILPLTEAENGEVVFSYLDEIPADQQETGYEPYGYRSHPDNPNPPGKCRPMFWGCYGHEKECCRLLTCTWAFKWVCTLGAG